MRTTGAQEAPLCPPVLGICSLSLRQGLLEMLWGGQRETHPPEAVVGPAGGWGGLCCSQSLWQEQGCPEG